MLVLRLVMNTDFGFCPPDNRPDASLRRSFIRADCRGDRQLFVHELAHTAQYERLGGIQGFLEKYLHECIAIGYPQAPTAIGVAERICR